MLADDKSPPGFHGQSRYAAFVVPRRGYYLEREGKRLALEAVGLSNRHA